MSTPTSLRLQAILGGIALAVVAARSVEMAQAMSADGATPPWALLLSTEAAIWLGWMLWALALVPLTLRVVERPAPRGSAAGMLVLLSLAPILLVPLVATPVHWWAFTPQISLGKTWLHMTAHNALTNVLLGMAFVGVAHSYLSLRRAQRLEVTAERLNAQLSGAQLETLRAQLDPHFLFNALNSIAVLARRGNVEAVEQMVTRLAGLLRHSLESSKAQVVTLGVELAALRHYLEIEQVRHGERLSVVVEVPAELESRVVPSFLLQPLVENAIRHGFTDPGRPLRLVVRGEAVSGGLRLTVEDDGAGLGDGAPRDGVGLGHTRARLTGLYGARASLTLGPGESGRGARVIVELPSEAGTSAEAPR